MTATKFHIFVDPFRLEDNRIIFSWTVEPESDLFRNHEIFFQYPDLDLQRVNPQIWYVMLFAHIAKAAEATGQEWVFHFPGKVSASHLLPWANYLELRRVYVSADCLAAEIPVPDKRRQSLLQTDDDIPIGVLLGGGKDSMLTLAVLGELYGVENVVAMVMAHHPRNSQRHRMRHEAQLMKPLSKFTSVPTRYLQSSIRNCFRTRNYTRSSGLVLYFATLLPYLATGRIHIVSFSYEFTLYYVQEKQGEQLFAHPRSRLESIHRLGEDLSTLYANPIHFLNINSALSKHVAFTILSKRYPRYMDALFMCEGTLDKNVKWCGQCWKCFEYIMMCLVEQCQCEIDIDIYISDAKYIKSVFEAAAGLETHPDTGNLRWSPDFGGHAVHYGTMCHSFAKLNMGYVYSICSQSTASTLETMRQWFGNRQFPIFDGYIHSTIERFAFSKKAELQALLAEYCPATKDEDEPFLVADDWVSLRPEYRRQLPSVPLETLIANYSIPIL